MLYLKRLVSGNKARFRDEQLNIELAYVTHNIIVMGFPAVGVESLYRNRRADVQRFLSARHGADFWVFNFCPVRENAYDDSVFEHRVSRYPFPDHHVPPFWYLSLVTREIHAWLSGSDARVAVLHCKAGKGRSGTLACAYLLSLHASLSAPLQGSFSAWSLIGEKEGLRTPADSSSALPASTDRLSISPPSLPSGADLARVSSEPAANILEQVLDLHTSKRMKPSMRPSRLRKPKMGVSIPSQQRWLSYWSQFLAGKGPSSLRLFEDHSESRETSKDPHFTQVKLTKLTIRVRELSGMQPHLIQAATVVITSTGGRRIASGLMTGRLWASLARYDDQLVDELKHWQEAPRGSANAIHNGPFRDDKWDKSKMIRSFAEMGISDVQSTQGADGRPISTCVLRALNEREGDWVKLGENESVLESSSHVSVSPREGDDQEDPLGVTLEANRELRIKLFLGEITLGWVWLIPAFHMSPDSPSSSIVLSNDDIDFAIGTGFLTRNLVLGKSVTLYKHHAQYQDVPPRSTPTTEKRCILHFGLVKERMRRGLVSNPFVSEPIQSGLV